MLQKWRQKLAIIQEWSAVERACIPAGVVGLQFLQYSAWGLYCLLIDGQGDLVHRAAIVATLPFVMAITAGSALLVLLGVALRRRSPEAEWFQHLCANYYGLALCWGGYLIGSLNLTTGLVLTGAPVLGFLLLSRRVMLVATLVAFTAMLVINLAAAYGRIPYAPLLVAPHDAAGALFWTHSLFFFAMPHVVVNTLLCAALLGQWRRREAGVLGMSLTDALTGVHNRRSILDLLDSELARARRQAGSLAVVLLDLDHFKKINDTWGHPTGDRVLQEIARVLGDCIRQSDAVGRFGGEEFFLLLPDTGREGALQLAERCRAALAGLVLTADGGQPVPVSASFGVACTEGAPEATAEQLVRVADEALYESKAGGRNRVTLAPPPATEAMAQVATPDAAPAAARWQGRLRQLSAVTESGFRREFGGRPWWQSLAGWRHGLASVREWSPVAKVGLVMGLLIVMLSGCLLWVLVILQRADSATMIDIDAGWQLAWLSAGQLAMACLLLAAAIRLRRHAPDARWFQYLALQFYSLSLLAQGYYLGILLLPTGAILTASPMLGFLLFRRRIVAWVFLTALVTVFALAYAGALGWLPYAPLVSHAGPAYLLHAPFWVYMIYIFYVPTLSVVLALTYQIFGRWREREAQIRAISLSDALTRVHNRRGILERLEMEVQRSARQGEPLTVALLDLDHFKKINDTWGHPTGDRVLQVAARVLKDGVRECDAVGRFGGEEFLLLLPDTSLDGARILLERCREQLAQAVITADSGERFSISASFGVTCREPLSGADAAELTRTADEALYRAKAAGRNRVEVLLPERKGGE